LEANGNSLPPPPTGSAKHAKILKRQPASPPTLEQQQQHVPNTAPSDSEQLRGSPSPPPSPARLDVTDTAEDIEMTVRTPTRRLSLSRSHACESTEDSIALGVEKKDDDDDSDDDDNDNDSYEEEGVVRRNQRLLSNKSKSPPKPKSSPINRAARAARQHLSLSPSKTRTGSNASSPSNRVLQSKSYESVESSRSPDVGNPKEEEEDDIISQNNKDSKSENNTGNLDGSRSPCTLEALDVEQGTGDEEEAFEEGINV
jgi:hypothetical protein